MNRSEFLRTSATLLGAAAVGTAFKQTARAEPPAAPAAPADDALRQSLAQAQNENQFVNHWLTDLFDTVDAEVDRPTQVKLLEGCGRGCFRRHEFKLAIARDGQGDVGRLITAYQRNFEIWREGDDLVHIRYGEVSPGCYCPAARHRPAKPNDIHCECTKATHQAIWETALGRPFKIDILESVRRGGKTCHLLVHLAPAAAS